MRLACEVGVVQAAEQLRTTRRTLYRAWDRWGLGRPTDRPEVVKAVNARRAARNLGRTVAPDHPWKRRAVLEVAERRMAAAG
jgi:hypothetical protein